MVEGISANSKRCEVQGTISLFRLAETSVYIRIRKIVLLNSVSYGCWLCQLFFVVEENRSLNTKSRFNQSSS